MMEVKIRERVLHEASLLTLNTHLPRVRQKYASHIV
jgi:hypothetical protein